MPEINETVLIYREDRNNIWSVFILVIPTCTMQIVVKVLRKLSELATGCSCQNSLIKIVILRC